jgi:peptidoglycan/LPS O-acetylase OafA/YrhL
VVASGERVDVVEALRGIASIWVACFHISIPLVTALPQAAGSFGWLGVDVFFVISGFVIPLSLYSRKYRTRDFPTFLLRRLVRLEPPYLVSIFLTIVLWHLSILVPQFAGSAPTYSWAQIGFHLFYLIPLTGYEWLGPNYWTLAYEFVFYVIVGLTFPALMSRTSIATFAAIVIATALFALLQHRLSLSPLVAVRVMEFGVGIMLMRLVVDQGRRHDIVNFLCLTVCLAYVFYGGGVLLGATVLVSVGAIFFLRNVKLGRWAYFIGGFSYSLYLTHTIIGGRIVNLGMRYGEGAIYEIALMSVALMGSIAFAIGFAYIFEAPAKRAAQRIGRSA